MATYYVVCRYWGWGARRVNLVKRPALTYFWRSSTLVEPLILYRTAWFFMCMVAPAKGYCPYFVYPFPLYRVSNKVVFVWRVKGKNDILGPTRTVDRTSTYVPVVSLRVPGTWYQVLELHCPTVSTHCVRYQQWRTYDSRIQIDQMTTVNVVNDAFPFIRCQRDFRMIL